MCIGVYVNAPFSVCVQGKFVFVENAKQIRLYIVKQIMVRYGFSFGANKSE